MCKPGLASGHVNAGPSALCTRSLRVYRGGTTPFRPQPIAATKAHPIAFFRDPLASQHVISTLWLTAGSIRRDALISAGGVRALLAVVLAYRVGRTSAVMQMRV